MKMPIKYLAAALALTLVLTGCTAPPEDTGQQASVAGITVYDSKGNPLITGADAKALSADPRWAYLEQAAYEGAKLLEEKLQLSWEDAQQALFTGEYVLYTAFDQSVFDGLQRGLKEQEGQTPVAGAVTDLDGRLLALYSTKDGNTNHATQTKQPCSAFKSLSVYAPALEGKLINWTTPTEDSPYKQVEGKDWPQNVSGTYSRQNVTVHDAVAQSLNTVAVKILAQVGVENSITFLQEKFGIPLTREAALVKEKGGDEVIGNIALGSLEIGVSSVDMAGFYAVFANGGKYQKPAAVLKLTDKAGQVLYQWEEEPAQVMKPENADVMNRLLQGVVKRGATGEAAAVQGVPIAGKTGTGTDGTDNWFVGVTPAYSCAVWHGQANRNQAAGLFSRVTKQIYETNPKMEKTFLTYGNLQTVTVCSKSGLKAGKGCSIVDTGYFAGLTPVPACNIHE